MWCYRSTKCGTTDCSTVGLIRRGWIFLFVMLLSYWTATLSNAIAYRCLTISVKDRAVHWLVMNIFELSEICRDQLGVIKYLQGEHILHSNVEFIHSFRQFL